MPWNPTIYNQFKDIRLKPYFDLMSFIHPTDEMRVIDLGCGTGEQTALLAEKFPEATILGVDSSKEMLSKSVAFETTNLSFQHATIEDVVKSKQHWNLIFSNAALQWTDDHEQLFPELIGLLLPDGQFAVQMPVQTENTLNKVLIELAQENPFEEFLNGWKKESPLLSMDAYTQLLFDAGLVNIRVEQRVYPIIAETHDALFDFISGSALIPYMERLDEEQQTLFVATFKDRIAEAFPKLQAIYAFKRLLLYGEKK